MDRVKRCRHARPREHRVVQQRDEDEKVEGAHRDPFNTAGAESTAAEQAPKGRSYSEPKWAAILRRMTSSGSTPPAAPRLSATCFALRVPGMAQVTAG